MNRTVVFLVVYTMILSSCYQNTKQVDSFNNLQRNLINPSFNDGLVVHCPFDVDATDKSMNAFNGGLHGNTFSDNSAVGIGALSFDGVDDYVAFPANEVYFTGNYSISIWCYFNSAKTWSRILDFNQEKPTIGNAVTFLIGRSDSLENNLWLDQWIVHDEKAVESIVDFERTNPANAYLDYNVPLKEWVHLAVCYNSITNNPIGTMTNTKGEKVPLQGEVTLYVNGQKHANSNYCLKPQDVKTINNWLGRSLFSSDPYFHGLMDDFRIYDYCLDALEVKDLYALKN